MYMAIVSHFNRFNPNINRYVNTYCRKRITHSGLDLLLLSLKSKRKNDLLVRDFKLKTIKFRENTMRIRYYVNQKSKPHYRMPIKKHDLTVIL